MRAYYLFSDFTEEKGFSLIADEIKKDITDYKSIVFIASSPSSGNITDKYAKIYLKWFSNIGINFESYIVLDNRMESIKMINSIKNASLIFLMGGTTKLQMKFIQDNKLVKPIKERDCVVMGLSAGAINMARTSILTITCGHDKKEIYDGIGLVDKSVEPHFNISNFNDELRNLSYEHDIYGICDESTIIIRSSQCFYYGDIYLLKDGVHSKIFSL